MGISNNILSIIENSPDKILGGISQRVKARRLEMLLTQKELAVRAGIALPTYRRFEQKGEISLRSLVMIGAALGNLEDFNALFASKTYENIDDLLKQKKTNRKRGKKSNGQN